MKDEIKECTCDGTEHCAHSDNHGAHNHGAHNHGDECKINGCGCSENHNHCDNKTEPKGCGCGCGCGNEHGDKKHENKKLGIILLAIGFVSLVASFVIGELKFGGLWSYLDFAWIAIALCGIPIAINAVKSLVKGKGFKGKVTSSLLITIAMIACITLQVLIFTNVFTGEGSHHTYIFAAGEVAWLMALGEAIEDFTVGKARSGIERLVTLSPTVAKYMIDGEIVEKPLSEVKVGDTVVVMPGDMISVDGVIVSGTTAVDQSIMTGESLPIDKTVGDAVYGGTFNKSGGIEIQVTRAEDDMTVNKLRKLVEEAEGKKAPISKQADKAASFIVPSAILLALAIMGLNLAFMGKWVFADTVASAIERGVTMLVVFCPCALVLATPTAVAAALGNATKKGILIKSGGTLETLAHIDTIAFDKTGTLTYGELEVSEIFEYDSELLSFAASAEALSEHPVAKAIVESYKGDTIKADRIEEIAGIGVRAAINGATVLVTKWSGLSDEFKSEKVIADYQKVSKKNVVAVVKDNTLLGIIALSDKPREGVKDCIRELSDMGMKNVMLTGDNRAVAAEVASGVGIAEDCVFAALMPEEKLDKIQALKSGGKVCMVGDGVNDAPALASADSSVAMGALGSDVAIEAADVALMNSDINRLPSLFRLARKMLAKVKINIAIAMTINVLAVILSATGILNPALGALVHNISSVLVVINSAFLLRNK